ncbi:MAG: CBS domain-containing protein [Chloracidobacterium sp.]|nr:CBS domain-containing protein [Chloracidobacterium sp.]
MSFDEAKTNFFNAARYGFKGQIRGLDGQSRRVGRLILEELLPRARKGLAKANVDEADNGRLIDVIERRVYHRKDRITMDAGLLQAMGSNSKPTVKLRTLTATMKRHQDNDDIPVHEWALAEIPEGCEWIDNYRTVEQFMAVDLYTVRPEDIVDLAASLMHWRHVRHVPVEDDSARLIGIVSHRDLIELIATGRAGADQRIVVRDIMKTNMITVSPETTTLEALSLLRANNIGCLPVIKDDHLVGIVTASDFLTVSAKFLEERLNDIG